MFSWDRKLIFVFGALTLGGVFLLAPLTSWGGGRSPPTSTGGSGPQIMTNFATLTGGQFGSIGGSVGGGFGGGGFGGIGSFGGGGFGGSGGGFGSGGGGRCCPGRGSASRRLGGHGV